jgi:O-acetyl-ADP-ribose deacetylase (regulator of RNase III)
MEIREGDLLDVKSGYIAHQVNARNVMGKGVALSIASRYPLVKTRYHAYCRSQPNPKSLLGTILPVTVSQDPKLVVLNIFGQLSYGINKNTCYTSYEALEIVAAKLKSRSYFVNMPYMMGCGLGNGDWAAVQAIFQEIKGVWWKV